MGGRRLSVSGRIKLTEARNRVTRRRAAAELVACDCVVLAETKDHANWSLIGLCAKALEGEETAALQQAYEQVEDEEDEHLYHSKGWCRELWLASLGMKAELPPLEEKRDVKSAREAADAKEERKKAAARARSRA